MVDIYLCKSLLQGVYGKIPNVKMLNIYIVSF